MSGGNVVSVSRNTGRILNISRDGLSRTTCVLRTRCNCGHCNINVQRPAGIHRRAGVAILTGPRCSRGCTCRRRSRVSSLNSCRDSSNNSAFAGLRHPTDLSSDHITVQCNSRNNLSGSNIVRVHHNIPSLSLNGDRCTRIQVLISNSRCLGNVTICSSSLPSNISVVFGAGGPSKAPGVGILGRTGTSPSGPFNTTVGTGNRDACVNTSNGRRLSPVGGLGRRNS